MWTLATLLLFSLDVHAGLLEWKKVLQYGAAAYVPTSAAQGDLTASASDGFAKLSDADINAMPLPIAGDSYHYYMLSDDSSSPKVFVRTSSAFSDVARSFGWSSTQVCKGVAGVDYDSCSWVDNPFARFDTESAYGPDCDRWFTDYSGAGQCYLPYSSSARCFSMGRTVGDVQCDVSFAMRTNVVMHKLAPAAAASPTFSPVAGEVGNPTDVTIASTGASYICSTTDGNSPACGTAACTTGTKADGASTTVAISAAVTAKAVGCHDDYGDSTVIEAAYTFYPLQRIVERVTALESELAEEKTKVEALELFQASIKNSCTAP